jgi:hypothetical protein
MGRSMGVADSSDMQKCVPFKYIAAVVTQKFFIAPRKLLVVGIRGVPRVAGNDGSAVNFTVYKAASGVAVGSGTLLHSGSYDLKGTADTNQTLTLIPDSEALTLIPGDSLGVVLTGTATLAVGEIQVTLEPA